MATEYTVYIRKFGTNYGKGDVIFAIENATNIGWSEYANDVGEAFFTISQNDYKALSGRWDDDIELKTALYNGLHMEIVRNGELVWAGWIGESDHTMEDVVVYGYSYASGLYSLLSDWNQKWTATGVHTIISDLWTRATTTLSESKMAWMTSGTIQDLRTTSGGATTLTMPLYNIFRKRILLAMKELVAYAISDTTNKVLFEITPAGVFNLWRNRGNDYSTTASGLWGFSYDQGVIPLVSGVGAIRNFHYQLAPLDRRTDLYAVGTSPNDVDLHSAQADTSKRTTYGRHEEPLYLQWVRDQDELDRVTKARLTRATKPSQPLTVTFYPNKITPFRATGADFQITDDVLFSIKRNLTEVSEVKTIVGQQVVWARGAENVKVILVDSQAA